MGLMPFPVVLGKGKRLFGASGNKGLRLTGARTVGNGLEILVYRERTRE